MKTTYKIWDIVCINRKDYQQVTTIEYICIYPDDVFYSCKWIWMLLKKEDIVWKTDSEWNIIF